MTRSLGPKRNSPLDGTGARRHQLSEGDDYECTDRNKERPNPMIELFNQSVARVRLTKTKSLILASLLLGTLVTLRSAPVQAAGPSPLDRAGRPADTFSILLQGIYQPVRHGPNLGLFDVDLSDGSFSTTKIFPVSGLPDFDRGHDKRGNRLGDRDGDTEAAIGNFYVQFAGSLAAYDLPGGALTMAFTGKDVQNVPDGEGGTYIVGTFDLDIREATGIYHLFVGGHNRMVDVLHHLADGRFEERCICIISRP